MQAFAREPREGKDQEILLKFRDDVVNPGLIKMLLTKYSDEEFAINPPTVEQLIHLAIEYLGHQEANRAVDYRPAQRK